MRAPGQERGYAMAALLVALSVMSVLLAVAMPVWKTQVQREKEEELIFRGQQYTRAIGLFQRRNGIAYPPSIDVLVQQRFLRKKFKDPMTGDDFLPLLQSQQGAVAPGATQQGSVLQARPATGGASPGGPSVTGGITGPTGGVMGVVSKSTAKSLRLYNGRNHYNEWQFIYLPTTQAPGGAPGAATPGGRPGQPNQPGRPGQPPQPGGVGPGGNRRTPNTPPGPGGRPSGNQPTRGPFGPQPPQPVGPGR